MAAIVMTIAGNIRWWYYYVIVNILCIQLLLNILLWNALKGGKCSLWNTTLNDIWENLNYKQCTVPLKLIMMEKVYKLKLPIIPHCAYT